MNPTLMLLGLLWGAVSAASLPMGAALGLRTRPAKRITSAMMAFGGGALLFALTIELFGHTLHVASDAHGHVTRPTLVLTAMLAAVAGGLLFQGLNDALNNRGAFLRKEALLRKHVTREKRREAKVLMQHLSKVHILRSLPPDEIIKLVPRVLPVRFAAGTTICAQGTEGDRLYIISSGRVTIDRGAGEGGASQVAVLGPGDVFGEIALISSQPRTATATAAGEVEGWEILRADFEHLARSSPALEARVREVAQRRLRSLAQREDDAPAEAREWAEKALAELDGVTLQASESDLQHEASAHGGAGAAKAIWLGIALDGIPESLVIGMLVVTAAAEETGMSLAFVAGVFLANLPEAMSSAVTMRKSGMTGGRIMWMWTSLCLMTGAGALLGTMIFPPHPDGAMLHFLFGIKGMAAGAMLTMIAETMLPEAFEQGGGPVVGLSTLAGFLAALAVKLIP